MRRRFLPTLLAFLPAGWAGAALAQAPRGAPAPPLALPAGMSPLPGGAFRLAFRAADASISTAAQATLAEIGRRLVASLSPGLGRVTVEAQASGPSNDASAARRLSLARAQAVRDGLAAGGLATNLIDVSPLGRQPAGLDAADILPPGAARASRR